MTEKQFGEFLEWSIPNYAKEHVRTGRWSASDSLERARAEHLQILPNGVHTPQNYLLTIHDDESGERVGDTWYTLQKLEGWPQVFIYWIGIDAQYRRKGYATSTFRQIEAESKRLGARRVALHVFGDNEGAISFYKSLGYFPTNIVMTKAVE